VIPAAGFGTRLLPFTKTVPKGMVPIVATPVIHYIVESAVDAGIEEIVLVTSANGKALEDYFDRTPELEHALERQGKTRLLEEMRRIAEMADIMYVRQKEQLGNGHAVLAASAAVGDEPFAVLWGDDILLGDPPVVKQLMDVALEHDGPVVGVRRVPEADFEKYGMLDVEQLPGNPRVMRALSVVEKPGPGEAPSDLAQIGGFVLTPDVFGILRSLRPAKGGEIWLADALVELMRRRPVFACEFTGSRYDAGNKLDFLRATVELALRDPEIGPAFRTYLVSLGLESRASAT